MEALEAISNESLPRLGEGFFCSISKSLSDLCFLDSRLRPSCTCGQSLMMQFVEILRGIGVTHPVGQRRRRVKKDFRCCGENSHTILLGIARLATVSS